MNHETSSVQVVIFIFKVNFQCDWSAFDSLLHKRIQRIPKVDSQGIPCVVPGEETREYDSYLIRLHKFSFLNL